MRGGKGQFGSDHGLFCPGGAEHKLGEVRSVGLNTQRFSDLEMVDRCGLFIRLHNTISFERTLCISIRLMRDMAYGLVHTCTGALCFR